MSDSMLQILINAKDNASVVMKGLGSTMDQVKGKAQSLASSGLNQMNKGFQATANVIKTGVLVGVVGLTVALGAFATQTVKAASQYQTSMVVLGIVAGKFGVNTEKAKELATVLGKDLRIGSTTASESLQYLIRSGLTLEQSADMLKRFTNEAVTGKSSSIDLATAVKNLAFAYTTGNSALGNMSGIQENFNDIDKKGLAILQQKGQLLGLTVGKLDEAQKMQARYAGMIELTNLTMGSSERLQGTFGDNMLAIQARFQELQVELGTRFLPVMGMVSDAFLQFVNNINTDQAVNSITESFNNLLVYLQPVFDFLIQNPLILQSIFIGLAGVIGTLVVGALFSMAAAAIVAMAPFVALGAVIGLLFYAWQSNFYGIRDITQEVLTFISRNMGMFAEFIVFIFGSVYDFLIGNTITFVDTLSQIYLGGFSSITSNAANGLANMLEMVGNTYYNWQMVTAEFWYMLSDIFNGNLTAIAQRLVKWAAVIYMIFSDSWERIKGAVSDIMTSIANGVGQKFTDMVNYVGDAVNKVIQKINEVLSSEGAKAILGVFGKEAKITEIQKIVFQGMDSGVVKTESKNWNQEIANMFAGMGDEAKKKGEDFRAKMQATADSIRAGGKTISDTSTSWKDGIKGISEGSNALKSNISDIIKKGGASLGSSLGQVQTGGVEMPNIMEGAIGIIDGAKSALSQAEQAQKAKDQADAQKSILEQQKKSIDAVTGGGSGGGDGKGAKEETQNEKDLKVLKAQLDIIKEQASVDIDILQKQKESLQYEEAKEKLTQTKLELSKEATDEEKATYEATQKQIEERQRQLDLQQLEIARQIQLRKDKLDSDSKPIEQRLVTISNTFVIQGGNAQDIAQEVSQILAQQYNAA